MREKRMKRKNAEVSRGTQHVSLENYRGQFVAIVNGRVVAHGKNALQVIEKANRIHPHPVISKVPKHQLQVLWEL